ncbi:hypothetical protein L484_000657 [Morus notabilis]|uniref:Uncharacterized protein n=1 Tax=Morus notabilis TaxID=981085 RepID=W9T271_9ROSA|nr:hypothetical protein L484_000657 [Morus notabilis]
MAPKRINRRGGSSSVPLVRSDPSLAAESSFLSTNSDLILREVEDYIPDPRDDKDSVDRLVEGEPDEEEASTSSAPSDSLVDAEDTAKGHVRAYKEGRVDGRWFEYFLLDPNFRASLPTPGYLSVYTRAFTAGMTLPIHPLVKGLCELHDIFPT